MKKYLALSVIASTLLMAGGDVKPVEPVVQAVEEESVGTFSGQLRAFYLDRTYSGILENNRNSLAIGGWVGYDTAEWNGLSAGFKAYGVEGFRIHDGSAKELGSASYDPSLYGGGFENYAFFGEAYLNYKRGNTNFKIGRQKLDTPLAGADDARMLPNLFEAAVLSNTDIQDTTLVLAHVTQMTVGTFGNVYNVNDASNQALSLQSGYGLGFPEATSGNFNPMGEVALGAGADTDGVTAGAIVYKGIENLTLQFWDYYAWDILNAVYAQADYGWNCLLNENVKMNASAQWINQSDVGNIGANIDANYLGFKLGASSGALSGFIAYSTTDSDTDNITDPGNGNMGIITPWGGMPAFTQGMVTRHQFFDDTDAWKVAGTWAMNEVVGANVKATAYYVEFDIGASNSYKPGSAWTAAESGFDIEYQATKDLNLRVRANYPTDFAPGLDWSEYRLIANYNF